jgi:biopolymer transport protein ExbB/TolQ
MLADNFFAVAQMGHEATMWILLALSVISVAFIIERWIALSPLKKKSDQMAKRLTSTLASSNLGEIENLATDLDSLEGRALSYGIRHTKLHGAKGLEEIFTSYAQLEKPGLEKHLNFLATVGSNAPFIGLLGTVFGIMEAFHGLATSQGEIEKVMEGISQSLVATALGLFVAIPAVISYNYFQKRVKRILQGVDSAKDICLSYAKTLKGS